jgi:predicted HicB family RNase H-like nuclease
MVLHAKFDRRDSDAKGRVLAEISAEPTKRLNVEIPASLHRRIKMASAAGDTTITEMVVDALERYLNAIE